MRAVPVASHQARTVVSRTSQGMSDIMIATNKEVLHSSARREDMLVSREGNLVTLINVFETKPDTNERSRWPFRMSQLLPFQHHYS